MKSEWKRILVVFVAAGLALGSSAFAQDPAAPPPTPGGEEKEGPGEAVPGEEGPPKEGGDEKPPKVDIDAELKRAQEYMKNPDKGIEVILRRSSVFEGIARKGILAEIRKVVEVEGMEGRREQVYAPVPWERVLKVKEGSKGVLLPKSEAEMNPPAEEGEEAPKVEPLDASKVGIRVWFFRQTRGFIFIPYNDIQEVRVIRVLSYKDSKALFQAIEAQERKLLDAEKKAMAEEQQRETVRSEFEKEQREKELAERKGLDATAAAEAKKHREELLAKFPPGEWTRDRKTQIMVRMLQGVNPTPEEKEFYKIFDEWEKAVEEDRYIRTGQRGG